MLKRWEFRLGIISTTLTTYKVLFGLLMSTHWLACGWATFAALERPEAYTWASAWVEDEYGTDPQCTMAAHPVANGALRNTADRQCYPPHKLYSASLHFAIMTVTSIGYGDIYPRNHNERLFGVAWQLVAGLVWACVVAEILSVACAGDAVVQ